MNELLRSNILIEDSTCVVRYNSPDQFKVPALQHRSPTKDRAVGEEAAAVSALSGKMIYETIGFCAIGAS